MKRSRLVQCICEALYAFVTHLTQRVEVTVAFNQGATMNSVTLHIIGSTNQGQTATVQGSVTVNGLPFTAQTNFSSSNNDVAYVDQVDPNNGILRPVRDPAGQSTRTCNIIATTVINGVTYTGQGVATVVTSADDVVLVSVDFGPPQ